MTLNLNKPCFINERDVVLHRNPNDSAKNNEVNHLLIGDYAECTSRTHGEWVEVNSRNDTGWLKKEWLTNNRFLEINFISIGQGDGCHIVTPDNEVILIDAGEGLGFDGTGTDNMARFINWRYNLRKRIVAGVNGATANSENVNKPVEIDYAIITHPDLDHYYGFMNLFNNKKLKFLKVCHNGLVERPYNGANRKTWFHDLGIKVPSDAKRYCHIWDTVSTNNEMHDLIKKNPNTGKFFLKTLRNVINNNKEVKFQFLSRSKKFLDHFKNSNEVHIEILAPITESITLQAETRECLPKLGNDGITKNGHSIVLKLNFKKIKILLGGALNSKSQDYIAQKYSGIETTLSSLEKNIAENKEKLSKPNDFSITKRREIEQELKKSTKLLDLIISKTRGVFQSDIAKAGHHGSGDLLDSFLKAINPIATIISGGDNASLSHPSPDALGAYGKSGRGNRPLIFSTELARITYGFSYPLKLYEELKQMEAEMNALILKKDKEDKALEMENLRDSNVAKYGMITVRTDGERVIIAQKLERERSPGQKWDIYDLHWNQNILEYEYKPS